LCIRKCNPRSMPGRTEAANRSGRFTFTAASFDKLFPKMYPKAKWPIANVQRPLNYTEDAKGAY
jgi:hypothetical protein